jgi:hypothetical protein
MASRNVRVLKRQQFTVPPSSTTAFTTVIPIATNIDVSPFKEAVAIARLHSEEWQTTEYVAFVIKEDGYTDEDPSLTFTGNTLNADTSLKFTEGVDESPAMETVSLTVSLPLPSMIKVDLEVYHGYNGNTMVFVLSLDIVLRD